VWRPFPQFPLHVPVSLDANVYLVALVLALVSGVLFGIVPVRQILRANPYEIVKAGSTGAFGRRITVRDVLLVVQIAICVVLVTSSMVAVFTAGTLNAECAPCSFLGSRDFLRGRVVRASGHSARRFPGRWCRV
jgi:hypothetical protein